MLVGYLILVYIAVACITMAYLINAYPFATSVVMINVVTIQWLGGARDHTQISHDAPPRSCIVLQKPLEAKKSLLISNNVDCYQRLLHCHGRVGIKTLDGTTSRSAMRARLPSKASSARGSGGHNYIGHNYWGHDYIGP